MITVPLRHFAYNKATGLLSPEGHDQMSFKGDVLPHVLAGKIHGKTLIAHAPAPRCQQSAEGLKKRLNMNIIQEDCLDWSPQIADSHNDAVKAMIVHYETEGIKVLIIISHDAMVNRIAEWMINRRGGSLIGRINLEPGECCLVYDDGNYVAPFK